MVIPEVLSRKAVRAFGATGEEWLVRLPRLLDAAMAKWRLTDHQLSPVISYNYLCFAESPDYGPVALKIGVPNPELDTEIEALIRYASRNVCRCHEADIELGAMLLERLSPGDDLTTVPDSAERIRIAAQLAAALPVPMAERAGGHPLPTLGRWSERAFARARREGIVGPAMLEMIGAAEQVLPEIETPARPRVLLHGDLNHWNILRAGDGWKAIDPKGAVGVRCFEAARFVLNELEMLGPRAAADALEPMLAAIAAAMGEPVHIIAACAFFDSVLSTCWSFEEQGGRDLGDQVRRCGFLLEGYRRLHAAARE